MAAIAIDLGDAVGDVEEALGMLAAAPVHNHVADDNRP